MDIESVINQLWYGYNRYQRPYKSKMFYSKVSLWEVIVKAYLSERDNPSAGRGIT